MKVFYTADESTVADGIETTSTSGGLYCTVRFDSIIKTVTQNAVYWHCVSKSATIYYILTFYHAMLSSIYCFPVYVCLCVCLLHAGNVWKQLHGLNCFLHAI